jgi:hypothetical protein
MKHVTDLELSLEKEQAWLDVRASIVSILVSFGILETRDDIAGFWANVGGIPTWVSVYELLEQNRD